MSNSLMLEIQSFYVWNMCSVIWDTLMDNGPWNNHDSLKILLKHMGLIKPTNSHNISFHLPTFSSLGSYEVWISFICTHISTCVHFAWEAMSCIPPLSFKTDMPLTNLCLPVHRNPLPIFLLPGCFFPISF